MEINKESLFLENEMIYLRPLCIEDITDEYINGLNDPEVNRYLVNVRLSAQTRESVESFVLSNIENPSSILFGIFIRDSQELFVGTVRVSGIDYFHYSASVGICLFQKRAWKKGFGIQALRMIKDYLFESLGLHYLEAGAYEKNKNSANLFLRAGFLENYRVRDKFRHLDSFEDAVFFSVINPSFDVLLLNKK